MTTNHRPGMGFRLCKSSTSMATSGWFACFPMGLVHWNATWQMPGGAVEIRWLMRPPADFHWQVFVFGWLKILHYLRTPIETFWHFFCVFIAWKWTMFHHIGETSGLFFLLQLREARVKYDAAETHAATHGYFSRQYPIIFYFWVVQGICHMSFFGKDIQVDIEMSSWHWSLPSCCESPCQGLSSS